MVVRRKRWHHELMYTASAQPTMYEQLILPLFVTGFLAFRDTIKSGLKEVMHKHLCELLADVATVGAGPPQSYSMAPATAECMG